MSDSVPKPSDIARFLAKQEGVSLDAEPEASPADNKSQETAGGGGWKAPWNTTDNPFNAEQAERLIANLKAENQRLRGERDTAMSVQHTDQVAQLETKVRQLETQLLNAGRATALAEANLPAEFLSFITATTADGIRQQVKQLSSLRGEAVPQPKANPQLPGFSDPTLTNPPGEDDSLAAKLMRQFGG